MAPENGIMNGRGSSPATAKPAFGGKGAVTSALESVAPSTLGVAFKRLRERLVIGPRLADEGRHERRLLGRHALQHLLERGAVGLGEHDVEGDGGGALIDELLREIREHRARPRPLAEFGDRALVDVDDADGRVLVEGLRRKALVAVEGDQAQRLHEERIERTHGHGRGDHARNQEDVETARPHFHRLRLKEREGLYIELKAVHAGRML